jgi:hypothetical protein
VIVRLCQVPIGEIVTTKCGCRLQVVGGSDDGSRRCKVLAMCRVHEECTEDYVGAITWVDNHSLWGEGVDYDPLARELLDRFA